jgi:hypothetical protein
VDGLSAGSGFGQSCPKEDFMKSQDKQKNEDKKKPTKTLKEK